MSVDMRFMSATFVSALLHAGTVSLFVGFAGSLFLLLLCFPLLSEILEHYNVKSASYIRSVKSPKESGVGRQLLASVIRSYPVQLGHDHYDAAPARSQEPT